MAKTLTLTCLKSGGGTYIVDAGRNGHRQLGVAGGGPADGRAMRTANRLLGRDKSATCLELTQTGGQWLLSGEGQFVITGADMNWRLNGRLVESYQVQYLEGDGLLTSTPAQRGIRGYLAINGTWKVPQSLGSAEAGLPGTTNVTSGWSVDVVWKKEADFQMDLDVHQHFPPEPLTIAAVKGPEWDHLDASQQSWLLTTPFMVHPDSNRQGIRLMADQVPDLKQPALISSPVLPGTVQLTPTGPILLGPDAQTIGGYPRVLLVADPELLALTFQVGIGGTVGFSLSDV